MNKLSIFTLPLAALALAGCATTDADTVGVAEAVADVAMEEAEWQAPGFAETETILLDHVRVLASDAYMGRKPGTEGGRMTVAYQIEQLRSYGYEPGWKGSFEQPVKLSSMSAKSLALTVNGTGIESSDIATLSGTTDFDGVELIHVESVDDIGDVEGKLAIISNPAIVQDVAQAVVGAGARGAILLAPQAMYEQYSRGSRRERVSLAEPDDAAASPTFIILGPQAGDELKALIGDDMTGVISGEYELSGSEFTSSNVIARLPGSRPEAGAIVMLAHWDHTGECGPADAEDRICNGAVDNASGVAAMLETARRLAMGPQLERDVYIFGTTAEEMGLLGAHYFASNPPVPLENIHAALNLDTVAIAPEGMPLSVVGLGRTPLDDSLKGVAASLGRTVDTGESAMKVSEQYIRRQDGWALMNKGVPTVLVGSGVGTDERFETYMSTRYHRPNDEIWDGYEMGGVANDIPVYVALMQHWATEALYSKPVGWQFDQSGN